MKFVTRFRASRWSVVVATVFGLMVGAGSIKTFSFGIFLKPLSADLGLSRGTLSLAYFVGNLLTSAGLPVLGWCLDRYGIRRTMLPWVAAFAVATAAQALLSPSLAVVYLLFAASALASSVQTPVAYTKAIAAWFDRGRGLALGIGVAGVGLGTAVIPPLAQAMLSAYGWRWAYVGLGCLTFVVAMPAVGFLLREPTRVAGPRVAADVPGLSVRQALTGSWRFWAILLAFFVSTIAVNGVLTGLVPLLTDRGLSPAVAASVLSTVGICLTVGRIGGGVALDRWFAPYVAAAFFVLPLLGIVALHSGMGGVFPFVGGILCGLGIGAEIDIAAYLSTRYLGLRAFGTLYGIIFGLISLANAAGPYAMNSVFDLTGSYDPALLCFEGLLALATLLVLPLGAYAYPPGGARGGAAAAAPRGLKTTP